MAGGQACRGNWKRTLACGAFVALCASLAWSGMVLGFGTARPFEAVSGHSMLPTLATGDLVVTRGVPVWSLRVGEIVAVHVPVADQTTYHYPAEIVHRISALYVRGTTLVVQTKGDSQGPDPFTVPASDVDGRMLFAVPYAGYGFLFLNSRQGHIALIGLSVLLLLYLALNAVTGAAEGVGTGAPLALGAESESLALAIREYGEHLRSHTLVVRELGDTTGELRHAAAAQNDILEGLRLVVSALAASGVPPAAAVGALRASRREEAAAPLAGSGAPEAAGSAAGTAEGTRRRGSTGARRQKGRHRQGRRPRAARSAESVAYPGAVTLYPSRRARRHRRRA